MTNKQSNKGKKGHCERELLHVLLHKAWSSLLNRFTPFWKLSEMKSTELTRVYQKLLADAQFDCFVNAKERETIVLNSMKK